MFIKKVDIKGFGKLSDAKYEFNNGLNIVYGTNEAGKTTLQNFIKGMLFGLKGGRRLKDGSNPPLKRYKPWSNNPYQGTMVYELDNNEAYTIARSFDEGKATIREDVLFEDISNRFPKTKDNIQFAEEQLGINKEAFERSAFIGQLETKLDNSGKKELSERLLNTAHSGQEDVSVIKALQKLSKDQLEKVGTGKSSTRPRDIIQSKLTELYKNRDLLFGSREKDINLDIKVVEEKESLEKLNNKFNQIKQEYEKIQLQKDLDNFKSKNKVIVEAKNNIDKLEQGIKKLNADNEKLTKRKLELKEYETYSIESCNEIQNLWQQTVLLQTQLKSVDQEIEALKESLQTLLQELSEYKIFDNNLDEINSLVALSMKEKYDEEESIQLQSEKKLNQLKNKERMTLIASIILGSMAVCLGGISFLKGITGLIVPTIFLILATVVTLTIRYIDVKKIKKLEQNQNLMFIEHRKNDQDRRDAKKRLTFFYEQAGVNNPVDFLRFKEIYETKNLKQEDIRLSITVKQEQFKSDTNKLDILHNKISELINIPFSEITEENIYKHIKNSNEFIEITPKIEAINEQILDKKNQIDNSKKTIESLGAKYEKIDEYIADLQKDINNTQKQIEKLNDTCENEVPKERMVEIYNKIEKELNEKKLYVKELETKASHIPNDEKLMEIEEEISILQQEDSELDYLGQAYEKAIDYLSQASDEIRKNFVPKLSEEIEKIIFAITDGKYKQIKADNQLMINVYEEQEKDIISVSELSGGTCDQIYFALRLAATRLIEKNRETLPIFLDESFSQYDDNRLKNSIKFLHELSKDRQIIYFTCRKTELELFKQLSDTKIISL